MNKDNRDTIAFNEEIDFSPRNVLQQRLRLIALYFAALVTGFGCLILISWQFDVRFLQTPVFLGVAMNPVTAFMFVMGGLSFCLLSASKLSWAAIAGKILITLLMIMALLHLVSWLFNLHIDIDTIFFKDKIVNDPGRSISSRMSPATAFNFFLTGISFLLMDREVQKKRLLSQSIAVFIGLIALLFIVGYLYKVNAFYDLLIYVPMAAHTAICFLLLAMAILFNTSDKGFMKELTSSFSGGIIARFLVPACIVVPIILGAVRLMATWRGHLSLELGVALLIVSIIAIFLYLTWYVVLLFNKRDALQLNTESVLLASEKQVQTIFAAAPDAVIVIDDEGRIMKWNRQAEALLGWKEKEVKGKLLDDIAVPLAYRAMQKKALKDFLQTGVESISGKIIESSALTKSGKEIDVALSIAISPNVKGGHLFIGFIRDLTGQKGAEQKFKALLDSAPDAMIICDHDGKIVLINKQTETLFGYEREELIGNPVEILIPQSFRPKHAGHRNNYFKDPKIRSMGAGLELFAIRKDATQFPVEISLSPLQTDEGMLVSAAVRDITDRKRQEEKFRLLLDSAPDAMIICDRLGKMVLVNKQTETLFGYRRDELIGKPVEILIPVDFHGKHAGHRNSYFKDPKIRSMGAGLELFAIRKDATQFPVEISLSPLQTDEGMLVSAAVRDITDRKKQEEKFRSLLNSAPDATVIVNERGLIEMVNYRTESLFGYTRDEIIGKPVEILIPLELREKHIRHREDFGKAPRVRAMGEGIELYAVKKNGSTFPVEISLSPLRTEEGMLVSASVRDITLRKQLQDELKKSSMEMEAFTYSVSHDLRAPLRGIIGFTAILEEDYASHLDDEARRITSVIRDSATKMGHLIDDLLAFSRIGKKEIGKVRFDPRPMINEVVEESLQQHRGAATPAFHIDQLPMVYADMSMLRQVWINLVSNAIKYSSNKEQPSVEIGSYYAGGATVFYIKDNGVGFDEKYKDKLFKVFQRLHSAEEFEGTGVGLALVERIIFRHGGNIWAESKEGEGACFSFSLPE